jgi:hypothetical protein
MANNLSVKQFFLVVLFTPLSVVAEWELVTSGYLGDVYISNDTLKKQGRYVFGWQLQNFKNPDKSGAKSRRILNQIDCKKNYRKILYTSKHSEQMGTGIFTSSVKSYSDWSDPAPKSVEFRLVRAFCEHYKSK